jgi:hypothetical protein
MSKYMAINIKKFPINFKKIPRYLALALLTTGASLILGFLSFGGMYALLPVLPLAFATFGLSVAYEGEIYLQNIKGAFKKLFKSTYLENYLAKKYLLDNFPENTADEDCPQFFKDYEELLKQLSPFKHKQLDKESREKKKQIEKALADMEKWFALQLFAAKKAPSEKPSDYARQLRKWLVEHDQNEWQAHLKKRQSTFNYVKGFSSLAALFMGLGSTYLIVEAFTVIPFFAAIPFTFWPVIIVPMAVIAGAAYGMLTYNTITDLINNDTINSWYERLRNDLRKGLTVRNVFMTATAVFLAGLAIALTICTAGTWWTVATNARPLFEWMRKIPSFIMGIINPIITGLSAISFNIQNTSESLEMVDAATRSEKSIFKSIYESIAGGWAHIRATENWLQIANPFRLLLKLTLTPLRLLLFLGHLVSMSLTSDRMPGVPQIVSVLVGIISEGFEDAHYFVGQNREQHDESTKALLEEHLGGETDHDQGTDIPTRLIQILAAPIYALAAGWDYLTSQLNPTYYAKGATRKALTLTQAWNKQLGISDDVHVILAKDAKQPSHEWKVEHTLFLIDKYGEKHLDQAKIGAELADDKNHALKALKEKVRSTPSTNGDSLKEILSNAKNNPVYNQHRLFAFYEGEKTATQDFIENLPERVNTRLV